VSGSSRRRWRSTPARRSRYSRDAIQPFPTFSEIYLAALTALRGALTGATHGSAAGRQQLVV